MLDVMCFARRYVFRKCFMSNVKATIKMMQDLQRVRPICLGLETYRLCHMQVCTGLYIHVFNSSVCSHITLKIITLCQI